MPRPSLKDKRSEEILNAYLTCVARFGLEGATQERIAAEAGIKRPLLRHYLGNKDQMVAALTGYVVDGFAASTETLSTVLVAVQTPPELVETLFDRETSSDPRLMLAWQALTSSVADYPDMRAPLLRSISLFLDVLEATLRRVAPNAAPERIRAVAQGISAQFMNLDALNPLEPPDDWARDLKQAALILAASLENDQ